MLNPNKTTLFRKVLAAYLVVIVGALFFTAAAFYFFTTKYLSSAVDANTTGAADLAENFIVSNLSEVALTARLLSENFEIKTGLRNNNDEMIYKQLSKELALIEADFISVTGENAVVAVHVAKDDFSGSEFDVMKHEPLFLSPAFQNAQSRKKEAAAIEPVFPGNIAVVAVAPISYTTTACSGPECTDTNPVPATGPPCPDCCSGDCQPPDSVVIGYIRIGNYIDRRFIKKIKETVGTDMAIEHRNEILSSTVVDIPGGIEEITESNLLEENYFVKKRPLISRGRNVANIWAMYPKSKTRTIQRRGFTIIAGTVILAFIGFIIVSAWMTKKITRPLEELAHGVTLVEAGDLNFHIPHSGNDEIGELASSFNRMTDSLKRRDEQIRFNQEQLVESGKLAAVGELAAGVAHEIGNPLAAISGYLQLMRKAPEEKRKHFIEELEKEAGFIDSIIRQLLDFSRPTQSEQQDFVLQDAIHEAMKMLSFHHVVKHVDLTFEKPDSPVTMHGSYNEIIQAVLNLCINAAQAMHGKGSIRISIEKDQDKGNVIMKIEDNGPGIPHEDLSHIFDPFFTTKSTGAGLGLSITHRIIRNHNGTIKVDSPDTGGTVFRISIPPISATFNT